jgi:hypothetical protein
MFVVRGGLKIVGACEGRSIICSAGRTVKACSHRMMDIQSLEGGQTRVDVMTTMRAFP